MFYLTLESYYLMNHKISKTNFFYQTMKNLEIFKIYYKYSSPDLLYFMVVYDCLSPVLY